MVCFNKMNMLKQAANVNAILRAAVKVPALYKILMDGP